jgi:hypothetical protein
LQIISDEGLVSGFKNIENEHFPYRFRKIQSGIKISVGSKAIYGFAFTKNEFYFNSKEFLSNLLIQKMEKLTGDPFIYLDIINFLGISDGAAIAQNKIFNRLMGRSKELAVEYKKFSEYFNELPVTKNDEDTKDILASTEQTKYISFWDIWEILNDFLQSYGCIHVNCTIVRSMIGTNPKIRTAIRSMGFASQRIGTKSSQIIIDSNNIKCLRDICNYVVISEVRVYGEHEIFMNACDISSIQKRYYKKDHRKIKKNRLFKDYQLQMGTLENHKSG